MGVFFVARRRAFPAGFAAGRHWVGGLPGAALQVVLRVVLRGSYSFDRSVSTPLSTVGQAGRSGAVTRSKRGPRVTTNACVLCRASPVLSPKTVSPTLRLCPVAAIKSPV